jgi:hypothetical protein
MAFCMRGAMITPTNVTPEAGLRAGRAEIVGGGAGVVKGT